MSTPLRRLMLVVALQFLVLLGLLGFKQYTVWTGETVLLAVQPVDPRDLIRGDFVELEYEISTIDTRELEGDDELEDPTIYVELREGEDGIWRAVAVHNRRESSFGDTALIRGTYSFDSSHAFDSPQPDVFRVRYGIESVFIPEGSGGDLPFGGDHTVAVEVKVDRFGNSVPRRFFVDGEPFELKRR